MNIISFFSFFIKLKYTMLYFIKKKIDSLVNYIYSKIFMLFSNFNKFISSNNKNEIYFYHSFILDQFLFS